MTSINFDATFSDLFEIDGKDYRLLVDISDEGPFAYINGIDLRIADSDFNQALCYAIIWREHGLDLDQVHQRLGLADASS